MEFRKNEWWGKIIRWNFFWLQLFLSHKPWFDCRYHAELYNNEIESPTFIIKFFHAYNCLSFSTDFPLYNPISKKKDSKNFVSHSINICLSKNKGFKASNFSLSAIKSCEISRVKIWCVKIVMYERNSFHRTGP